jgi:hypothetical protein
MCAIGNYTFPIANNCTRGRGNFEGLSHGGGPNKTIAEILRASFFIEGLSKYTTFSQYTCQGTVQRDGSG